MYSCIRLNEPTNHAYISPVPSNAFKQTKKKPPKGRSNRKSLREDFLCQPSQDVTSRLWIQSLKYFIHTLPMIISNRSQPITRYKSTDSPWNIGYNESENSTGSTACNFVKPPSLVRETSSIRVISEGFFEDICELSVCISRSIICVRGWRLMSSGIIVFFTLKVNQILLSEYTRWSFERM